MYLSSIQKNIIHGLRHGALDHYQLAADIVEAPFRVRAELKALKRQRLVSEHIRDRHVWELTGTGWRTLNAGGQLELGA